MRIEANVVINRPIEEVWAFMTDPFNVPRFGVMTLGGRMIPGQPGPPGVGTTYQGRAVILGFEIRMSVVVTEYDPPHAFAVSVKGAGIRTGSLRETHEATAEGTKIVRVVEFEPRPLLKPLWWIYGPFFRRRQEVAVTQNIKRLLEADRG